MKLILRRFPVITIKPIPSCEETNQFFLVPSVLVGKGYFTLFWIQTMMTVNFNTTLIKEN